MCAYVYKCTMCICVFSCVSVDACLTACMCRIHRTSPSIRPSYLPTYLGGDRVHLPLLEGQCVGIWTQLLMLTEQELYPAWFPQPPPLPHLLFSCLSLLPTTFLFSLSLSTSDHLSVTSSFLSFPFFSPSPLSSEVEVSHKDSSCSPTICPWHFSFASLYSLG